MVRKIRHAVKNDLPEVQLWVVQGTTLVAFVKEQDYLSTVTKYVQYLVEEEEYESIPACNALIDHIKINNIIRDSR